MLAEGLVALAAATSSVNGILGTPSSRADQTNGIFPNLMPEAAPLPALVYSNIHAVGEMTHDGPDPFTMARMEFSCHGASYEDATRLARAVRNLFESYQGTLSDGSQVDSIHRLSEIDIFEDAPFSFAVHVDFAVAYRDLGS